MVGAVGFKYTNGYEARIYMVGTYNQIDWTYEMPCVLGENYVCYKYKNDCQNPCQLNIVENIGGNFILRLVETKRYVLRIIHEDTENVELPCFQNESNKFLKLEKDRDSIFFQFINYLGQSRVKFENGVYFKFEVVPEKMNYDEDYISLTEALAEQCSALLLEHTGATSNQFKQCENNSETLLEQFIFLRQFCYSQNMLSLFASIKRNPDRILMQDDVLKPIGYGIPSKKFYTNPFSYGKGWQKLSTRTGNEYVVPREVAVTQKHDSIDTPANRFIKYALGKFDDICVQLLSVLEQVDNYKQTECLLEAKNIHNMISSLFNEAFFKEIGNLEIMPQNNQVLQKREGYSQIFSAYSMIDLALQLDWSGKDAVYDGESKNVALLYEYWLFFELYKIISSIEGCEKINVGKDNFLTVKDGGITISLQEGKKSRQSFVINRLNTKINLYYNRTFSNKEFNTTQYEGSYSRAFRPDYTLAIFPASYRKGNNNGEGEAIKHGAVSFIHFDAKYRISDLTSFIGHKDDEYGEEDFAIDKAESIINTYKRGDLLKMHTYNDAIRRTIGSFVLYPGKNEYADNKGVSFNLYDEILPGVGAFAIRPSIDEAGEAELKKFIISLLESKGSLYSRLNRMNHFSEMVLREPAVSKSSSVGYAYEKDKVHGSGEKCVLGYIRDEYYDWLKSSEKLTRNSEFYFYFYAINNTFVYSHHPEIFNTKDFCFYRNKIDDSKSYIPEHVLCNIESNELISKKELVERLVAQGYMTSEDKHNADFYYVLKLKVVDDNCVINEMQVGDVNHQNGNDAYSPHSPKLINRGD